VSSYDSGYEHSIEHLIELRLMVMASAEDTNVAVEELELAMA
jgi:hypothetical protein